MQLHELSIAGFGRLINTKFTFRPGLNLIIGPNEAGKSTLLTAIFSVLYGFFDSGSITNAHRKLLDAYRPWDTSTTYRGALTFSLQNGQRYRVDRTFGPRMTTSLSLIPQGNDISSRYRSDTNGRLYFADELFGMSRTVFENTCCVRQSELAGLNKSASAITEAIMRLTTSGATDASAGAATEMLRIVLRDEIGTARASTKPTANAQKELERLEQMRKSKIKCQNQLWSLTQEINQNEAQLLSLQAQKDRLTYLKSLAEQAEMCASLTRINEACSKVEHLHKAVVELASYADVDVNLQDEIQLQAREWKRRKSQVEQVTECKAHLKTRYDDLEVRVQQASQELGDSEYNIDLLPTVRERIIDLRSQWRHVLDEKHKNDEELRHAEEQLNKLRQQLDNKKIVNEKALTLGQEGLIRLQASFEQTMLALKTAEHQYGSASDEWVRVGMSESEYQGYVARANALRAGSMPAQQHRGCNPFHPPRSFATEEPTELTILAQIAPIHDALEHASNGLDVAQKHFQAEDAKVHLALGLNAAVPVTENLFRQKIDILTEIDTMATEVRLLSDRHAEINQQRSQISNKLTEISASLREELLQQGFTENDLLVGVEAYLRAYEYKRQYMTVSSKVESLQQQQETVLSQLGQIDQQLSELAAVEERVCSLLVEAGLGSTSVQSIEQGLTAFQLLCEKHAQWQTAKREFEIAEQHMQELQKMAQEHGTVHQIEVAERELFHLQKAHPELKEVMANHSKVVYEQQLQETIGQIQTVNSGTIRLRYELDSIEGQAENLADLYEQQMMAENRVRQLTRGSEVFSKAIDLLQEATTEFQKAFAPRLETRIAHGLTRVTSSRYDRVRLNPSDLGLDVWAPETKAWVPTDHLSTGTRDLIYIVMRTAISDLLGNGREPLPILLDDPFVHLDSHREQQALNYLGELSQEQQILYFTKDHFLPERIQAEFSDPAVTCLSLA
jgi:DNA repair exonuclease SbcCD ATPase subunit